MDEINQENESALLPYIAVLERKGCSVRRDLEGQFSVKLPDNSHLGGTFTGRSIPHEWMTVLEAVDRLGITANDL